MSVAPEKTKELTSEIGPSTAAHALEACKANLGTVAVCGTIGVGLALVAVLAIAAAPGLAAAGFGVNGVVSGSVAASVQSGIGSVVAPGLFATLQSAGAGGYGIPVVYGAVQVVGGTIASSATGVLAWSKAKS